jgi:uncharacterized protein (DUF1501 family)
MKQSHTQMRRTVLRQAANLATFGATSGTLIGTAGGFGLPHAFAQSGSGIAQAALDIGKANPNRILVVLELSGGNDGLNTLVPFTDDAYYRHRPKIAIRPDKLRKIDQHFGFNSSMAGFERLFKDGNMAVVHGVGYAQPSFSHFTSMAYWHTAAPNSGEEYGWMGRLADHIHPTEVANAIINIDETQSLAVRARRQVPVVFNDPDRFTRKGFFQARGLLDRIDAHDTGLAASEHRSRQFLHDVARSAQESSQLIREACAKYKSPIDYGIVPLDLPKIAALISAGLPTRLYYTSFRHNAFDTHVQQADLHQRLLSYASDSVSGFMKDMQRLGRADDVVLMVLSEFGRRVPENTGLGTDHGTANHMYLIGKSVKGGHFGQPPDLAKLDEGQNMQFTTDFRRVYASAIQGWFGIPDSTGLLGGRFDPLPIFQT